MEWTLPVNEMLRQEITKLGSSLLPPGLQGDVHRVRAVQDSLGKLVDTLGTASASAQGLHKVITTTERLRSAPHHDLYLLKDAKANRGSGEVIGFLKVGRKHLFLFDERDRVIEVEPLCVLDFYVETTRQRHGYGRKLFDHMLQDMGVTVDQLAIDGPSPKMDEFLRKNYGIERLLRQSNNFAVAPSFFSSGATPDRYKDQGPRSRNKDPRPTEKGLTPDRSSPAQAQPALGRFAARRPPSLIANVIHGGGATAGYHLDSATNGVESTEGENGVPEKPEPVAEVEQIPPPQEEEPQPEPVVEVVWSPPSRPASLSVSVEHQAASVTSAGAGSSPARRDSQLTDRGYFDVKFYHNKLW